MPFYALILFISLGLISRISLAEEKIKGKSSPTNTALKIRYEPNSEQKKLIESAKEFARKHHESDIKFSFHDHGTSRAGALESLRAKNLSSSFYRSNIQNQTPAEEFFTFLKSNKPLFLIDDQTIDSLVDISSIHSSKRRWIQTYQGVPVYNSTILLENSSGISSILSGLVPTKMLNLKSVVPKITPERVVEINWSSWNVLPNTAKKTESRYGGSIASFQVPVTQLDFENGKKIIKNMTASVALVVYAENIEARLAWCFIGFDGIYDAMTGERIAGSKGPRPSKLRFLIRPTRGPSRCPYSTL